MNRWENIDQNRVLIKDVNLDNISALGIYCIKNKKAPGYQKKIDWFKKEFRNGLKIFIACDESEKQLGFIECTPAERSWRPILAGNYLFVHCVALFGKNARNKGIGSALLKKCEEYAFNSSKAGVCAMSSDGPWMSNKNLFLKNGFDIVEEKDRFELLSLSFTSEFEKPKFADWHKHQSKYQGWHLIYSDQCPWHEKSINDLRAAAENQDIDLTIRKLISPEEALESPSGFGTFSLIKDGKLLADHYISKTRFNNIIKKEINT